MRCGACNRPLTKPAVSVQTRGGLLALGPVCARRKGLLAPAKQRLFTRLVGGRMPGCAVADEIQFELFEVAAMRITYCLSANPVEAHKSLAGKVWKHIKALKVAGHRVDVTVKPAKRSNPQNSKLHAMILTRF